MSIFPVRILPVMCTMIIAAVLVLADEPKDSPKLDEKADALPNGAKARFGAGRLIFRSRFTPLPPDYKTILAGDATNAMRRVDIATGLPIDAPRGNFIGPAVIVSGNGKRMVAANTGILSVRGSLTGAEIQKLEPPAGFGTSSSSPFQTVALSGDGKRLAQGGSVAGNKAAVLVWDVDKAAVLLRIELDVTAPAIPVLSADGKTVAVRQLFFNAPVAPGLENDPQRSIFVWDVDGKKEILQARVTPPSFQTPDVALAADGSLMAASFGDGAIELWDLKAGTFKQTILGRTGQGVRIAIATDSKLLAAVAEDGTIQRWNLADGKLLDTTEAPEDAQLTFLKNIALDGANRAVAWGTNGTAAVVWEAPSGKLLTPRSEHTAAIKSLGFSPDGKELISAGLDGRVIHWDLATAKMLRTVALRGGKPPGAFPQPPSQFNRPALQVAPNGARGISAAVPAAVFDLATGAELFAIPRGSFRNAVYHVPSADASKVLAYSIPNDAKSNGVCTVWDAVARKKIVDLELSASPSSIPVAAFSPDGTKLVTAAFTRPAAGAGRGLAIVGWDLTTGKKLGEVEDKDGGTAVVLAAASNTTAVVSSGLGRVYTVDFEKGVLGDEIDKLPRGDGLGGPVVFAPDGKRFAVAASGEVVGAYAVRIYDWPNGKHQHTFVGHSAAITALTFTPDGKFLASGSQDTTVLLWDMSRIKDEK